MKRLSVLALLSVSTAALFAGAFYESSVGPILGNRDFQTREVSLSGFSALEVGGGIAVEVERGSRQSVMVRAESNILPHVQLSVAGSTLRIRTEPGVGLSTHGVTVSIQVPALEGVLASGGSPVRLAGGVAARIFRADLSGGASLRGEIGVAKAWLGASGGAVIDLSGACDELELEVSGGGRFLMESLRVATADVDLSGGSQARLAVSDVLTASVSGGSRLAYRGSPTFRVQEVSGGGSIEKIL